MDICDVLVVGAGPTGLMMASELRRYGLNCILIDKNQGPSDQSKALAIQPRTLEIFHLLGISSLFINRGQKIEAMNPMDHTKKIAHIPFSILETPFPFILSLPQSHTEQILAEHLHTLGGKIERETELVALSEESDKVIADLRQPTGETRQIAAKWVIGCDGAHSFVRKHLQLTFIGKAFHQIFSLADVKIQWKYPHNEVYAFFHPNGPLAAIPLPGENQYRLIFLLDRCQEKAKKLTSPLDNLDVKEYPAPSLEETKQIVAQWADPSAEVSDPQWLANFHVNSRLTSRYQVGKLFLAGDAAHIHSPIGGQGMNTGLQDAFNLSWKLAMVHREQIDHKILESYHEERHHIAIQLLKGTEIGTHLATLNRSWEISIRNFFMSMMLKIPSIQKKLLTAVAQLYICYPKSSIIYEKGSFSGGPKAGMRLPNATLQNSTKEIDLYTFLQKPATFTIFLFGGRRYSREKLGKIAENLSAQDLPLSPVLIHRSQPIKNAFSRLELFDPEGKVHKQFNAEKGAAYIIRPDTYISYRQTPLQESALQNYLKKI